MDVIDLLLKTDVPDLPEKEFKVKRLSELCGGDVVFSLRALPYSRAAELSKMEADSSVHIILAGTVSPDLKNSELLEKHAAATPAELVKKMLLPGEIEDLSREVEKLSGYRQRTLEELKKK